MANVRRYKTKEGFHILAISGGSPNAEALRESTRKAAQEARREATRMAEYCRNKIDLLRHDTGAESWYCKAALEAFDWDYKKAYKYIATQGPGTIDYKLRQLERDMLEVKKMWEGGDERL